MRKLFNLLYSLIGIIGGIIVPKLIYIVSPDVITSGKSGQYLYIAEVMAIILIGSYLYNFILKIVKSIINTIFMNKQVIHPVSKYLNFILYTGVIIVISYLSLQEITTEDTPLLATIIVGIAVAIFTFVYNRKDDEFYIAIPKSKNKKIEESIIKENNKRVKLNIIGLIVGFIFVAMITIIHKIIFSLNLVKDQEMDNVLKIVIILIISGVTLSVIGRLSTAYAKSKYNKNLKYYYIIGNYFIDSFIMIYTILSYLSFIYFLNINYYLAFCYMIGIKIIVIGLLERPTDPEYIDTTTGGRSYYEKYIKKSNNYSSDMRFEFYSNGVTSFSYDIAPGISKTTYTDKNGKKTDVTSFDITDDVKYKSITKRD